MENIYFCFKNSFLIPELCPHFFCACLWREPKPFLDFFGDSDQFGGVSKGCSLTVCQSVSTCTPSRFVHSPRPALSEVRGASRKGVSCRKPRYEIGPFPVLHCQPSRVLLSRFFPSLCFRRAAPRHAEKHTYTSSTVSNLFRIRSPTEMISDPKKIFVNIVTVHVFFVVVFFLPQYFFIFWNKIFFVTEKKYI